MHQKKFFSKIIGKKTGVSLALITVSASLVLAACGTGAKAYPVSIVVSNPDSVLMDTSFSQSSYEGVYDFMSAAYGALPKTSATSQLDVSTAALLSAQQTKFTSETTKTNFDNKTLLYGPNNEYLYPNPVTQSQDKLLQQTSSIWKQPRDSADALAAYRRVLHQGAKMIVAPGFNQDTSIKNVFINPVLGAEFSDTGFILIDSEVHFPNVASVVFQAEQGGFLLGIALGLFMNMNNTQFGNPTTFKAATYGGMAFPSVTSYMGGFEQGVKYFTSFVLPKWNAKYKDSNPADSMPKQLKPLEMVYAGQSFNDSFIGSFAPGAGQPISKILISKGAQAIFPVAGPQTPDVVNAINSTNSKAIVLGVDTAQENDKNINQNGSLTFDNGSKSIIQFSALKNLRVATGSILKAVALDQTFGVSNLSYNGFFGLGYRNVGTYQNNGVGVSAAGMKYLLPLAKIFNSSLTNSSSDPDVYKSFPNATSTTARTGQQTTTDPALNHIKPEFQNTDNQNGNPVFKVESSGSQAYKGIKPYVLKQFLEPQLTNTKTNVAATSLEEFKGK